MDAMSHQKKKGVVRTLAWISAAIVLGDIIFFLWVASDSAPLDAGSGLGLAILLFVFVLPILGIVLGAWLVGWIVAVAVRKSIKKVPGNSQDPEDW